jgi:hypothetical protein
VKASRPPINQIGATPFCLTPDSQLPEQLIRRCDEALSKAGSPALAGLPKRTGVFGAGASLPQFLSELTVTLNSLICDQDTIILASPQDVFP